MTAPGRGVAILLLLPLAVLPARAKKAPRYVVAIMPFENLTKDPGLDCYPRGATLFPEFHTT